MAKGSHTRNPFDAPVAFMDAVITVGATDSGLVAVQVVDTDGNNVRESRCFIFFLSDNATGLDISTDAPSGGVAAGADGSIVALGTNTYLAQTESNGHLNIALTEAAADSWYLVIILPTGKQLVSSEIKFV